MKYSFHHPDSLIKEIEIYKVGKQLAAIVEAPAGSDPEALASVKTMLNQKGFNVVADAENGKHLLRLQGVASAEQLLSALADTTRPAVVGDYTAELTDREQKENKSLGDLMKEKQLTMAGLLYLAADTALIAAGLYRTKGAVPGSAQAKLLNNETVGGILWAIPSILLIAAGQQSPDVVNGFAMRDIKKKLDDNGIVIPEDTQTLLNSTAAGNSMWDRAVQLVYNHAPEINNAMQVWGGLEMSAAGKSQENLGKQAAGLLVALGMGLGLVLPEKEKHKSHDSGLGAGTMEGGGSPLDALNKKGGILDQPPQFYAGLFPRFNNVLNFVGGVNEKLEWNTGKTWLGKNEAQFNIYKKGNDAEGNPIKVRSEKNYAAKREELEKLYNESGKTLEDLKHQNAGANTVAVAEYELNAHKASYEAAQAEYNKKKVSSEASSFNIAASLLYIFANQCYSHTSKENTADIEKVGGESLIVAAFANIVHSHPKEQQAALTEHLSMMLAEDKHINLTLEEASVKLHEKVEALNTSPWLASAVAANNIVPITRHKPQAEEISSPDIRITTAAHQAQGKMIAADPQLMLQ